MSLIYHTIMVSNTFKILSLFFLLVSYYVIITQYAIISNSTKKSFSDRCKLYDKNTGKVIENVIELVNNQISIVHWIKYKNPSYKHIELIGEFHYNTFINEPKHKYCETCSRALSKYLYTDNKLHHFLTSGRIQTEYVTLNDVCRLYLIY